MEEACFNRGTIARATRRRRFNRRGNGNVEGETMEEACFNGGTIARA